MPFLNRKILGRHKALSPDPTVPTFAPPTPFIFPHPY